MSLPTIEVIGELFASPDPIKAFKDLGGTIRFTCGTHYARLGSVGASCTMGEHCALKAWAAAVERRRALV